MNDGDGDDGRIDRSRRALVTRLGLAAGTLYMAPVMLRLGLARASSSIGTSISSIRPRRRARRTPPEIVVSVADPALIDQIAAQGYGLLARDRLVLLDLELARFSLPAGVSLEQARQRIQELAPAALLDLNHLYRPSELSCGSDTCRAFEMIGWRHAAHACSSDTAIGMVDTAVNTAHAALEGVDVDAFPVLAEGRQPASAIHGTAIAILMAGRRDTRTPGLLDGASIVAAEAFHRDTSGQDAADAFDIARAIVRLLERGVRVVNLSFTGPANSVLERVVTDALERDVILVAAAGNSGPRAGPLFPAAYPGVVAVTAVDAAARVYRQANAGDHIDFAAPGVRLWTAASVRGGRFRSGTSYAAPFVSAALAAARARQPDLSGAELVERLAAGAVDLGAPGRDATYGWGLIQPTATCRDGDGQALLPVSGE